ncbi:MAG: AMP-binding protein [Candidatus Eisenbacteria bacterium]|nr:AMP-binding protein [Candidatus Latescibacterota bacterium]MBD3301844.1 AMP-binding protein [Candidatus Eisenbacteria bacterium]
MNGNREARVADVYEEILGRTDDAERPAILGADRCTYGELRRKVDLLAARLRAAGAGPGRRIGIALDPSVGYLVALLGIRAAGATAVLFGTAWTPFEQRRCFQHARPSWILSAGTPAVGAVDPDPVDCVAAGAQLHRYAANDDAPASEPDDAVIIYTSGTTGAPKGVVLPAASVSANVRAVAEYLELGPEDSTAAFTPTCYAYAVSQFLTHALAAAAIRPIPTYLRYPMAVLQACHEDRLTGLAANPTSFRIFTRLERPAHWDLNAVRTVMSGGQFLDARLVASLCEVFPSTRVVNMYGATENAPRISYHWLEDRGGDDPARFYPVGTAVRGTRIEIRAESGAVLPPGETGEVVVTGNSLMRGFWQDPEATAKRVRDGWLHTGDLGRFDEAGRLHLTGRSSNVINVGNEKVSPEDVERKMLEVAGVAEAGVYGVPDPLTGESVRAKIVLEEGAEIGGDVVQIHLRRALSSYKIPREIEVVDALPRTLYGKLDRRKLKED